MFKFDYFIQYFSKILLKCTVFCVSQALKVTHKYRSSLYSFIIIIYTLPNIFNADYKILFYHVRSDDKIFFYHVHYNTFHRKPLYLNISIYYSRNVSGWIKQSVFQKIQYRFFFYKNNLCFNYSELNLNLIVEEWLQQTSLQLQYIILIYRIFQVRCSLKLLNFPICHNTLNGEILFKVSLT